jgi:hypothetical protein
LTAFLLIAKKVFGSVPWWVWLAVAFLAWGGWQRHQAKSAAAKYTDAVTAAAAERETKLVEDAQETARRLQVQKGITNAAQQKAQAMAADVARARTSEQRLLEQLAAIQANTGAGDPAAPAGSPPAGASTGMLADLLGRCVGRVRRLAEGLDASRTAGETCEASYDALTAKPYRAK